MVRRLVAVMWADVAGYARLMDGDEDATHAQFNLAMTTVVHTALARHRGRIVKSTGDGFLAVFSSAIDAVQSSVDIQTRTALDAAKHPESRRLLFRIGINVGDVIVEDQDIYGHHVNLAARLGQVAEPGCTVVSGFVREYVRGRVRCSFQDLGKLALKNIDGLIRGWRIHADGHASGQASGRGTLRLSLFGPFNAAVDGRELTFKSVKARALIGYLAAQDSLTATREQVVGLLWSESPEAQARAVLRQVVRELRGRTAAAGFGGLHIGTSQIGLASITLSADLLDIFAELGRGAVHPLLLDRRDLTESFLAGLDDLDPAFRSWLLPQRQILRERLLRELEAEMVAAAPGSARLAALAQALVNQDPTHEHACRCLMRARAAAGDDAGALRIYNTLWTLLADDYDVEPSPETQALVAEIKVGSLACLPHTENGAGAAPAAQSPGPTRLALFMAPISFHGLDGSQHHLASGFRQQLIGSLVRCPELNVSDATFAASGTAGRFDPADCYELQLSVHQSGPALLLLLMLRECETSVFVWSDGFELSLESWFQSQRRVVQRVTMALNVHLSAQRLRRLSGVPDVSLKNYDRWLRSQTLIRTFDAQHWKPAAEQFRDIIAAAPDFVPAYCGLVDMLNTEHIVHPGRMRTRERERQSLQLARQAIQIDPSDMRAHRSLAWSHAMAGQHGPAMTHMQTACDLNPCDSWTHTSAALLFAFCGNTAVAGDLARVALDLTLAPSRTQWSYLVDIEFLSGNYQEAVAAADQAQQLMFCVPAWRAAALAHLGKVADAREAAQAFLRGTRGNWFGPVEATADSVAQWMLHQYPIARAEDWERLREGLRIAGLPVGSLAYARW